MTHLERDHGGFHILVEPHSVVCIPQQSGDTVEEELGPLEVHNPLHLHRCTR